MVPGSKKLRDLAGSQLHEREDGENDSGPDNDYLGALVTDQFESRQCDDDEDGSDSVRGGDTWGCNQVLDDEHSNARHQGGPEHDQTRSHRICGTHRIH